MSFALTSLLPFIPLRKAVLSRRKSLCGVYSDSFVIHVHVQSTRCDVNMILNVYLSKTKHDADTMSICQCHARGSTAPCCALILERGLPCLGSQSWKIQDSDNRYKDKKGRTAPDILEFRLNGGLTMSEFEERMVRPTSTYDRELR